MSVVQNGCHVRLVTTPIISRDYLFVCVVRTLKTFSLSNFPAHSTVSVVITVLYVRSPEFIHLLTESLSPSRNISPCPPSTRPLVTTTLFSVALAQLSQISLRNKSLKTKSNSQKETGVCQGLGSKRNGLRPVERYELPVIRGISSVWGCNVRHTDGG